MSKLTLIVTFIVGFAAGISGFNHQDSADGLAFATNQFAFNLYNILAEKSAEKNVFFSPFSIITAMTMLLIGAQDKTLSQISAGLSLDDYFSSIWEIQNSFKTGLFKLNQTNGKYDLSIANRILIQKDSQVNEYYRGNLKTNFDAVVDEVDFENDGKEILKNVNQWVNDKTHGMIKELLDDIDDRTKFIILNAIFFKGEWKQKFDEKLTNEQMFHMSDKESKMVPFMFRKAKFSYKESIKNDYKLLELDYEGNLSMVIVLPNKINGLNDLLATVQLCDIEKQLKVMKKPEVELFLPKFNFSTKYSLKSNLEKLGITDLFTVDANLKRINSEKKLTVSEVLHKAVIEVDEEGTKAAAVTGISVMSLPQEANVFKADHPFLFFIRDKQSGLILFMGSVKRFK